MCNNSVITVFRIEGTSSERLGFVVGEGDVLYLLLSCPGSRERPLRGQVWLLGRETCYNSYFHVPD